LLECYDKVMDDEEVAKLDKIIEYLRQFDIWR
jgi:hypothetical protein